MNEDALQKRAKNIRNQTDFIAFLDHLIAQGRAVPGDWENQTAVSYVDGFRGYLSDTAKEDRPGKKAAQDGVSWQRLAEIMLAARVYE